MRLLIIYISIFFSFLLTACLPVASINSIYLEPTDSSQVNNKKIAVGWWEIHPYKSNSVKHEVLEESSYCYAYYDSYGIIQYPQILNFPSIDGNTFNNITIKKIDSIIYPNDTIEMNGLYEVRFSNRKKTLDSLMFENGHLLWKKTYVKGKPEFYFDFTKKYKNERFSFYAEYYEKKKLIRSYLRPKYLGTEQYEKRIK